MPMTPNSPPAKIYSDEILLEELRRVAQLVQTPFLSLSDFNEHSIISPGTLINRFGNWRIALERAGIARMYRKRWYSDEDLLEEVRRVARLVKGPALTHAEFNKHSRIDSSTIRDRFGNWRTTLERAGVANLYYKTTATAVIDGDAHER